MNVAELKRALEDAPDDAKVVILQEDEGVEATFTATINPSVFVIGIVKRPVSGIDDPDMKLQG